ncbi:CRISPR system precrRNA processing endoribonuclease RAMP protein Cas6 [Rhodoferax sp. 4810]|uniref:CRISPR system precrRNA processing endoribonuclease RAMP protein Cas6 n=1 Tax=Thiospirillum jenense TaxID=1653858 RepID=A0A839H7K3_9GAMM|nr:CRISPR system precrRNA processing endoribonuclease RAMP protein Cas6 [Thiospirillum jenense]MBB1077995.1 CRISPR system precrRNA processing endoribonuclease RAMP protein Cas6 [Rhodoferax jenense]MBB1125573.1 CRISPR system precrRNA processing endoribonuclease RAMP protein Cas6 [Thiospirillum jenense]
MSPSANSHSAITQVIEQTAFFPLTRFRFHFLAEDPIRLPDYPGSAWRGLLGHGLRRTCCVTHQPTCTGCLLIHNCVYSTLFETPAPATAPSGYTALPHPFVLAIDPTAPRHLSPGTSFSLTIHLLGSAIAQAPYLIHALGLAGQRGFGRSGGRFAVTHVECEMQLGTNDWSLIYTAESSTYQCAEMRSPQLPAAPPSAQLRLITPLRLKRDGHFVGARDLTAADLVQTLYRRLFSLATSDGGDPQPINGRAATALHLQIDWLEWREWTRYSSRQDARMQLGGLIGMLHLSGVGLPDLWPALWFGQWTHIGKGTAFGLGGYRVINSDMS